MQGFAITALLISYPSCVLWFLDFTRNFDKCMDFTNSLLKSILLSCFVSFPAGKPQPPEHESRLETKRQEPAIGQTKTQFSS